jgi:integrating conjugative element protein (TIGR03765 family)
LKFIGGVAVLLLHLIIANGSLVNIGVVGNAIDINPYLVNAMNLVSTVDGRSMQKKANDNSPQHIDYVRLLTVKKSDLTLGVIQKHTLNMTCIPQPIFVVGDDSYSIAWAKKNSLKLRRINALGLIINVKNYKRVKDIESVTNLSLNPVKIAGLHRIFPVSHYPFLLVNCGIEQ